MNIRQVYERHAQPRLSLLYVRHFYPTSLCRLPASCSSGFMPLLFPFL
jgi:hypothetical protein